MFSVSPEYEEVTNFLQGFIDNEVNLNIDQSCTRTCFDYVETKQYGCHNDTLCGRNDVATKVNVCKGTVRDCRFIESDVEICPSVSWLGMKITYFLNKSLYNLRSYIFYFISQILNKKRYKSIKFGKNRVLGIGDDCAESVQVKIHVLISHQDIIYIHFKPTSSLFIWLNFNQFIFFTFIDQVKSWTKWFVRCHNCFCICDESNIESERHFNLREVTSDIYSNK